MFKKVQNILFLSFLFVFFTFLSCADSTQYDIKNCYVYKIADGDTFTCRTEYGKKVKVRLAQIDAPEMNQRKGKASENMLKQQILNKNVSIKLFDTDQYQRIVGEVYYQGIDINKLMVQTGNAWAYRRYLRNPQFLILEEEARKKKIGIWADKNPVYPPIWRQKNNLRYQRKSNIH